MANAYFYSNTAVQTTLTSTISNVATSFGVNATTGFPISYPYVLALDYGGSTEELVLVTSASGTVLTVTRGFGGTSAQGHTLGAIVRHVYNAVDATDYRTHEASSSGVHGVTGSVVGTTDTQTLTNKTLASPSITGTVSGSATYTSPNITGTVTGGASYTSPTITGTVAGSATYTSPGITGTVTGGATYNDLVTTGSTNSTIPFTIKSAASPVGSQLVIEDSGSNVKINVDNTYRLLSVTDIVSGASGAVAKLTGTGQVVASPSATNVQAFAATNPSGTTADVAQATVGPTLGWRVDSSAITHMPTGYKAGASDQWTVDTNGRPKSTTFTSAYVTDATSNSVSGTSYAAISTPALSATAVVPPSGQLEIFGGIRWDVNAGHFIFSSFNVSGSTSGTLFSPNDSYSVMGGTTGTYAQGSSGRTIRVTSAVPGETVTVTWQHRVDSAGGTATIYSRTIGIVPLVG